MIAYTLGYTGDRHTSTRKVGKIAALKAMVEALDAVLIDIRFSPNSRAECWRKALLKALLGPRYMWVQELGNVHFKSGEEIAIKDMDAGLDIVLDVASTFPVILLCACEDFMSCHRKDVAIEMYRRGFSVFGLTVWDKIAEKANAGEWDALIADRIASGGQQVTP